MREAIKLPLVVTSFNLCREMSRQAAIRRSRSSLGMMKGPGALKTKDFWAGGKARAPQATKRLPGEAGQND